MLFPAWAIQRRQEAPVTSLLEQRIRKEEMLIHGLGPQAYELSRNSLLIFPVDWTRVKETQPVSKTWMNNRASRVRPMWPGPLKKKELRTWAVLRQKKAVLGDSGAEPSVVRRNSHHACVFTHTLRLYFKNPGTQNLPRPPGKNFFSYSPSFTTSHS